MMPGTEGEIKPKCCTTCLNTKKTSKVHNFYGINFNKILLSVEEMVSTRYVSLILKIEIMTHNQTCPPMVQQPEEAARITQSRPFPLLAIHDLFKHINKSGIICWASHKKTMSLLASKHVS